MLLKAIKVIQHVPVIAQSGMPMVYHFQKGASHTFFLLSRMCFLNQRTTFLSSENKNPPQKLHNPLLWDQILCLCISFSYVVIRPSFTLDVIIPGFIVELFLVSYSAPFWNTLFYPLHKGLLLSCLLFWQRFWSLEP